MVKYFSGAKIEDMKHYLKPRQEKQLAQIIVDVGNNDLPDNKNSDETANKILEFANSIKTSENNVTVSSMVSRKDRFNNKAKEGNEKLKDKCEQPNLQLIQHDNINPFRHTNAKGLHLRNYGDRQLTRNFTSLIENG